MNIILGQEYTWKPTTDEFRVRAVKRLTEGEGGAPDMYEIVAHAYADELTVATTTYGGLLYELADILYPLDQPRDHEWNGGDVCDALAMLLDKYAPHMRERQQESCDHNDLGPCPTCDLCEQSQCDTPGMEWDGEEGVHVKCVADRVEEGIVAYLREKNHLFGSKLEGDAP